MKKKLLVFAILLLALNSVVYSQFSKYIIDTSKVWSYVVVSQTEAPYIPTTYRYTEMRIRDEVSFNDTLYRRIIAFGMNSMIREKDGIVYSRRSIPYTEDIFQQEDVVIYNFNFNVGDSMNYYYYDHGTIIPYTFYVSRVDSINIDNTWLKRIFIGNDVWIEGVGSIGGFNWAELVFADGGYYGSYTYNVLTCIHQNNNLIYTFNDTYPECGTRVGLNDVEGKEFFANIYPTIVKNYLTVESSVYPLKIRIMDILGREVGKETVSSKKEINCSNLDKGIYNFIFEKGDGRIKTCKFVVSK